MDEAGGEETRGDAADAAADADRTSRPDAKGTEKPAERSSAEPSADALAKLEAARKSVEDAASVSGVLWLSYLFTLFYIGVAAGGVTHKQLLLEDPVKLPFLSVDLPLVAFFALSPILFVIVHAYPLMHFIVLAAKTSICSRFSSGA